MIKSTISCFLILLTLTLSIGQERTVGVIEKEHGLPLIAFSEAHNQSSHLQNPAFQNTKTSHQQLLYFRVDN